VDAFQHSNVSAFHRLAEGPSLFSVDLHKEGGIRMRRAISYDQMDEAKVDTHSRSLIDVIHYNFLQVLSVKLN
jgi:hypothetical protein